MKKVLICDDDDGIVEVIKIVLEEKGYKVETLGSSEDVVEKINKVKPSLILLDLWMPHLTGQEIAVELRKDPITRNIPIVIISASSNTKRISQDIKASDCLLKPFDIDDLEKVVEKYL